MSRAVLLLPYMGKLPVWLDLFLLTCSRNPDFRFVFFHDGPAPISEIRAPNVEWRHLTFDGLFRRMFAIFDFDAPKNPTTLGKVCDLRPALGELFADEIGDTPFWGYSDIDQIWGRMNLFLTDAVFQHDVISGHHRRLCGPFTLYRNTTAINRLWRSVPNMREILSNPVLQFVEETAFSDLVMAESVRGNLSVARGIGDHAHSQTRGQFAYVNGRILKRSKPREKISQTARPLLHLFPRPHEYMFFHFRTWKSKMAFNFDLATTPGWMIGHQGLEQLPENMIDAYS